jgi:protein TonB
VSEQQKKSGRGRMIAVIIGLAGGLALLAWGILTLLNNKSDKPNKPPKITLMAPPPPPPPPPPKFEKKPEPKEQKEVKVEQAKPKEAPPQPSPDLKMEGPAGDGPSAFSAGKITNEDLSKIGTGGNGSKGGSFSPFNNYANFLKGDLQRYLKKNNTLRQRRYIVEVHVWVKPNGEMKKFELIGSTGDSNTDDAIQQALTALTGFDQPPPQNMPQPIRLRIITAS